MAKRRKLLNFSQIPDLFNTTPSNETITVNTTVSLDMVNDRNLRRYLLQANLTVNFSTNLTDTTSYIYSFVFKQDAVGGRTVTWNTVGTTVLWQGGVAPIISDQPDEITVITIIWTGQEYLGVKSCGFNV